MTRTVGIAALGALLAALAGCDRSTGSAGAPAPGDDAAPPTGEILLASPPAGGVETGALQTPVLRMAEYGPEQDADGELERITFEAQAGQPLPDPIDFVLAVSRDLDARCRGFEDINVSSGLENGYPTSVRLMICPAFKDSPNGQVVMAKAIQGNDKFYVITRRLRSAPLPGSGDPLTAQEMAAWTTHLRGIRVCDTRNPAHPCPDTVPTAAADGGMNRWPDQKAASAGSITQALSASTERSRPRVRGSSRAMKKAAV